MNKTTWAPLLCALALAAAERGYADEGQGGFLADAKGSLVYKNYYWNEDIDIGAELSREEWVHGALINFNSGYWRDLFALDYSFGAAEALNIPADVDNISNLRPRGGNVQDPVGIAATMALYGKFKLLDTAEQGLQFGVGKRVRKRVQYADNTSRLMPSSTVGYDFDYRLGRSNLYFTQIEKFSARTDNAFGDPLTNLLGQEIDHVAIIGGDYTTSFGTRLTGEYLESKNYLRSVNLRLAHRFKLASQRALSLSLGYGNQRQAGALFEAGGVGPWEADDHYSASFVDATLRYGTPGRYVAADLSTVYGDDYNRGLFAQDHGTVASPLHQFYWFGLEDETMLRLSGGFDLAALGLAALRWDGHYAFSDSAKGFDGFERREWQSLFQLNLGQVARGLNLIWLYNRFDTRGTPDGISRSSALFGTPAGINSHHASRFYLVYAKPF